MMPAAPDAIGTAFVGDEIVLYDRDRRRCHILNATAGAVWAFCDGATTRDDAVAELAAAFGADPAIVGPDVDRIVAELKQVGLLGDRPGPPTLQARAPG